MFDILWYLGDLVSPKLFSAAVVSCMNYLNKVCLDWIFAGTVTWLRLIGLSYSLFFFLQVPYDVSWQFYVLYNVYFVVCLEIMGS